SPHLIEPDAERWHEPHAGDDDTPHAGSWPRRLTAVAYKNTSAMRLDEADRVLDGHDLLGRVIGDFAAEFLLEGHHQLDRIEAVCPQIVDKAGVLGHLGLVDAEMLDDDLLDPLGDVAHANLTSESQTRAEPSMFSYRLSQLKCPCLAQQLHRANPMPL